MNVAEVKGSEKKNFKQTFPIRMTEPEDLERKKEKKIVSSERKE